MGNLCDTTKSGLMKKLNRKQKKKTAEKMNEFTKKNKKNGEKIKNTLIVRGMVHLPLQVAKCTFPFFFFNKLALKRYKDKTNKNNNFFDPSVLDPCSQSVCKPLTQQSKFHFAKALLFHRLIAILKKFFFL